MMNHTPYRSTRILIPLGIGTAVALLGDSTLYTVLPDPTIAAQAGVSLTMVGILLGLNRFTRMIVNGPIGALYDRLPRRGLLITAMLCGALAHALFAAGHGPVPLLLGRITWGLAWAGLSIGGHTVVLDIATRDNRGRLNGQYQMWLSITVTLSAFLGGAFTDMFGYRGTLWISAGLAALVALGWLFLLPETRPVARDAAHNPAASAAAFPWRVALLAAIPFFVMRLVFHGVLHATTIRWLATYLDDALVLPALVIPLATFTGMIMAARKGMLIFGSPAAGILSDRIASRWIVITASLVLGALGLWMMSWASLALAITGTLIAALTSASVHALVPAIAGDHVDLARQGRALSLIFIVGDLGSAIGPPLALNLLAVMPVSVVYRLCAVLLVLAALFGLWRVRAEALTTRQTDLWRSAPAADP